MFLSHSSSVDQDHLIVDSMEALLRALTNEPPAAPDAGTSTTPPLHPPSVDQGHLIIDELEALLRTLTDNQPAAPDAEYSNLVPGPVSPSASSNRHTAIAGPSNQPIASGIDLQGRLTIAQNARNHYYKFLFIAQYTFYHLCYVTPFPDSTQGVLDTASTAAESAFKARVRGWEPEKISITLPSGKVVQTSMADKYFRRLWSTQVSSLPATFSQNVYGALRGFMDSERGFGFFPKRHETARFFNPQMADYLTSWDPRWGFVFFHQMELDLTGPTPQILVWIYRVFLAAANLSEQVYWFANPAFQQTIRTLLYSPPFTPQSLGIREPYVNEKGFQEWRNLSRSSASSIAFIASKIFTHINTEYLAFDQRVRQNGQLVSDQAVFGPVFNWLNGILRGPESSVARRALYAVRNCLQATSTANISPSRVMQCSALGAIYLLSCFKSMPSWFSSAP
ncbi:hypothetical protein BJ138DRAFT_1108196, partial [Hygrophoropsis aurantiaca]